MHFAFGFGQSLRTTASFTTRSGGCLVDVASTLVTLVMVLDLFVSGASIMHSDPSGQAAMMRRPNFDDV